MLAVGLGHTLHHVLTPMRDARGIVRALLANFVLVPLYTFALLQVLPLDRSYATGLMLIATAAGAPFLLKLTMAAHGNVPLAASLLMLLIPVTIIYMPVVVPLIVPGSTVGPVDIALPLVLTMLLPMAVGLLTRARLRPVAERLRPWMNRLSTIALLTIILSTVAANLGAFVRLAREGTLLVPALVIVGAFLIGFVLGREYRGGDVVLGLGTGQRNIAAAMVVATQGLEDANTVLMVVFASVVDLAVLFPIAWGLKRRAQRFENMVRV
ncbi:MAG: bile acid:sodium symporter family protein [Myxococcales bacterium]